MMIRDSFYARPAAELAAEARSYIRWVIPQMYRSAARPSDRSVAPTNRTDAEAVRLRICIGVPIEEIQEPCPVGRALVRRGRPVSRRRRAAACRHVAPGNAVGMEYRVRRWICGGEIHQRVQLELVRHPPVVVAHEVRGVQSHDLRVVPIVRKTPVMDAA